MRKVIILLVIVSLIGLIGCERYEIYDESELDSTPAGPDIPQWISIEIIDSDEALFVELDKPVEITARIQPLIGDMENGYFLFELPDGVELLEGSKYSETDFNLKEKELFETKIKVAAKEPFERGWITFTVGSDFPAQAVRGAVIREQGKVSLNSLEEKISRWEQLGFQGYDTIEVKKREDILYNIVELWLAECLGCGAAFFTIGKVLPDYSTIRLDESAEIVSSNKVVISYKCSEGLKEKTKQRREEVGEIDFIDYFLLTQEEIDDLKKCVQELEQADYCEEKEDCCGEYLETGIGQCYMRCVDNKCVR